MSYEVFTDTSANLPLSMADSLGLRLLPFSYITDAGQRQCMDPDAFDGDTYYEAIRRGLKVTTAQISPQQYSEAFRPVLESGRDLLFVSMSSGISGSFSSSFVAAQELRMEYPQRRIELVDTLAASLGEGIIAVKAAALRDSGVDVSEAAAQLRVMRDRMCQVFTVDDLMHLRRSGRLSNISAIMGTVLHIKPILVGNEEGKIVAVKKVRGRRHSVEVLAQSYAAFAETSGCALVGIAHAGCREDAERLKALLMETPQPPEELLTVQYEPVTGSHVGPGALALFFLGGDNVRTRIQSI